MIFRKLTFICVMASFLSFFGCSNTPKENNIPVAKLHELLQDDTTIVLDVRTPKEIAAGKITSKALEADFYDDEFIENAIAKISKDDVVYVYCKGGTRSAKAVVKLRALGYVNTYNVEGGMKAWKAKGYETEK